MSQQVAPSVIDADADYAGAFVAIIYNDDRISFDAVIRAITEATGCSLEEAYIETWEAHHFGKAAIHYGTQTICCAVASIVSSIGVKTEVRPEWPSA
jgi:ATP-dependent Clp protease adaptor protein ClpS